MSKQQVATKSKNATEAAGAAATGAAVDTKTMTLPGIEEGGAVTIAQGTALAEKGMMDFAADAGMGLEGTDKASFAIPFLVVLQSNSPVVVDETVPGAKAGMFMNSVTNELFAAVDVVPVAFQRRYLAWAPRSKGGGFKGEFTVAAVEGNLSPEQGGVKWATVADEKGVMRMTTAEGNLLKDTRNHFVMFIRPDGTFAPALISLSSTQIKKSKKWLSRIQGIQMRDGAGRLFNPPSFSHVYRLTTVSEENDQGKWKGIDVNLVGPVTDADLYQASKAFHGQVVAGKVEVAPPVDDEAGGGNDEQF